MLIIFLFVNCLCLFSLSHKNQKERCLREINSNRRRLCQMDYNKRHRLNDSPWQKNSNMRYRRCNCIFINRLIIIELSDTMVKKIFLSEMGSLKCIIDVGIINNHRGPFEKSNTDTGLSLLVRISLCPLKNCYK